MTKGERLLSVDRSQLSAEGKNMTARNNIIGKIDWWLLFMYVALVFIGVSAIYAAAFNEAHPSIFDMSQHYGKQFLFAGVSIFLGLIIMLIDAKFFNAFAYVIYGISILSLLIMSLLDCHFFNVGPTLFYSMMLAVMEFGEEEI